MIHCNKSYFCQLDWSWVDNNKQLVTFDLRYSNGTRMIETMGLGYTINFDLLCNTNDGVLFFLFVQWQRWIWINQPSFFCWLINLTQPQKPILDSVPRTILYSQTQPHPIPKHHGSQQSHSNHRH